MTQPCAVVIRGGFVVDWLLLLTAHEGCPARGTPPRDESEPDEERTSDGELRAIGGRRNVV